MRSRHSIRFKNTQGWTKQLERPWVFDIEAVRLAKRNERYARRNATPKFAAKRAAYIASH